MTRFEALAAIRARKPLLHCISNLVTANDCANLALAVGASPIMAQAPQEMADIAVLASAVVLNTGTPDEAKFTAARLAGAAADGDGPRLGRARHRPHLTRPPRSQGGALCRDGSP